jgi:hypothetical protein
MRDGCVHRGCIRTSADLGDRRAAASGGARGRPRQRGSPPMTTRAAASVGATPARGGQRRPPGSLERRRQHIEWRRSNNLEEPAGTLAQSSRTGRQRARSPRPIFPEASRSTSQIDTFRLSTEEGRGLGGNSGGGAGDLGALGEASQTASRRPRARGLSVFKAGADSEARQLPRAGWRRAGPRGPLRRGDAGGGGRSGPHARARGGSESSAARARIRPSERFPPPTPPNPQGNRSRPTRRGTALAGGPGRGLVGIAP